MQLCAMEKEDEKSPVHKVIRRLSVNELVNNRSRHDEQEREGEANFIKRVKSLPSSSQGALSSKVKRRASILGLVARFE